MPRKKSGESRQTKISGGIDTKHDTPYSIEDLLLPRALVAKIAKESLPDNMPLPRDGVTALMRGATMFTSYITAEAESIARTDNRKTITHTDILKALEVCDFASFVGPTQELVEKAEIARQKSKASGKASEEDKIEEDEEPDAEGDQQNSNKKRASENQETAEEAGESEMQVD